MYFWDQHKDSLDNFLDLRKKVQFKHDELIHTMGSVKNPKDNREYLKELSIKKKDYQKFLKILVTMADRVGLNNNLGPIRQIPNEQKFIYNYISQALEYRNSDDIIEVVLLILWCEKDDLENPIQNETETLRK